MYFLQVSATLVGIRALTYTGMMANQRNNNHHNYNNEVEGAVHTRAAFHQFREETQQIIGEIQQMIAALLARKSSYNNNDQYIQRRTPNKKIALFDGDMCKLDFIDWLLHLEECFNFWKICNEEKVRLPSNKLDDEAEKLWEDIQIDRKR